MNLTFIIIVCLSSGSNWSASVSSQEIGESCLTSIRETGVCIPQSECLKLLEKKPHRDSDFAETCKLQVDGTPVICCVLRSLDSNKRNSFVTEFYPDASRKTFTASSKAVSSNTTVLEPSYGTYVAEDRSKTSQNDYETRAFDAYDVNSSNQSTSQRNYPTADAISSKASSTSNGRPTDESIHFAGQSNQVSIGYLNGNQNVRPSNSQTQSLDPWTTNIVPSNNHNTRPSRPNQNTRPSGTRPPPPSSHGNVNAAMSEIHYPSTQSTKPSGIRPSGSSNGLYVNPGSTNGGFATSNGNQQNGGSAGVFGNGNENYEANHSRSPSATTQGPIWGSTSNPRPITESSGSTNSASRPVRPQQGQQNQRISEQKCMEYTKSVTETVSAVPLDLNFQNTTHKVSTCKFSASILIVGGSEAKLGEFPHMAALGYRSGSVIEYNCGGTLISEEYVLTAAHCVQTSYGNPVNVRLGDLNIASDNDQAQPLTINVASTIVHSSYKPPQLYNDIALIRLTRKVPFSTNLRPACLQVKRQINSSRATATGWGTVNYGEVSSDDLLKVHLDLIDNKQCNALYGPDDKLSSGITDSMMCAGVLAGKKDTCQGDSGGPLQVFDLKNPCIHYVIGITSFGKSCGATNSPGIYTRVSEYVSWVESIVWKNQNSN